MLRSAAQISFSELYIDSSTRRSDFFKKLKTLMHREGMEKEIRKYIKKPGNKRPTCLQWDIVIQDDAFDSLV
ncbi:MAG: hypothetical protein ACMUEL_09485 [Flavobacteriales bacterium Tduv]